MNDTRRITVTLGAFIAALGLILVAAAVPAFAGSWLQAYGKTGDCMEGWGESWQEWAVPVTGGAVCTREVDDPSQPVETVASQAPAPQPPQPSAWTWIVAFHPTLQGFEIIGGSLVGWCPNNTDPRNIRATPNTGVAVLYYGQLMEGYLENLGATPRTFDLEIECYL